MADAERDRNDMNARIEQLEMDKKELEAENIRTIEENRNLLDQLEMLNGTVADSEIRIRTLEATLQSSQQALRRLEGAAARAADMERHISVLEQEQLKLQNGLVTSEADARSAIQRWKRAERGISDLQEQLERIEKEAKEERERHVEVLGRMERQREMERELSTAAGRLKGAAAAKSLGTGKNGSSVVSHFVRDLLQDNANLQLGIAELREMLMNSNDEIQTLREQLMFHQPALEGEPSAASTLRAELEPRETVVKTSQELHIHHHYHVSPKAESKKPKKKRQGLSPGIFTPPTLSAPSTPPTAGPWRLSPSPAQAALSRHSAQPSTSTISAPSNRWSVFSDQPSEFAPSSVPSSPTSNHRNSVFDPLGLDTGAPPSPTTSVDPMSPTWRAAHRKLASDVSARSFPAPVPLMTPMTHMMPMSASPTPQPAHPLSHPIEEEDLIDDEPGTPDLTTATDESTAGESTLSKDDELIVPRLRRTVSHESIMSLAGGLDIHTLKSRPSQLTLRPLGGAGAVVTGVTARPTIYNAADKRGSMILRDNFSGLPTPRMVSTPAMGQSHRSPSPNALGRWVAWRPWGGPSSPATASISTPTPTPATVSAPKPAEKERERESDFLRAPGINQPGPIPGFQQYWAAGKRRGAPSKTQAETVDQDALREVLEG
jgi:hypothetical protein